MFGYVVQPNPGDVSPLVIGRFSQVTCPLKIAVTQEPVFLIDQPIALIASKGICLADTWHKVVQIKDHHPSIQVVSLAACPSSFGAFWKAVGPTGKCSCWHY